MCNFFRHFFFSFLFPLALLLLSFRRKHCTRVCSNHEQLSIFMLCGVYAIRVQRSVREVIVKGVYNI